MVKPRIYVIIVTWNGMKWMKECMDSIRRSTVAVATVVIDNGSTDGTCAFIRDNYPEVILFETGKNLGFGKANNVGMRYALDHGADYVYLLNQDAYVYPDMFAELLNAHAGECDSSIGILSPLHLYRDRSGLDALFKDYIKDSFTDIAHDILTGELRPYYLVDGVPAAGWLIPRTTLETVGGFDPIFFHYDEDNNYIQRLNYHGFRTAIVPSAKMIHDRELFGNKELALRDQIFRSLKCYYFLNINYSKWRLIGILTKNAAAHSWNSVKSLCHLEFKRAFEYPNAILRSISKLRQYKKDRKINRRKGQTWLN